MRAALARLISKLHSRQMPGCTLTKINKDGARRIAINLHRGDKHLPLLHKIMVRYGESSRLARGGYEQIKTKWGYILVKTGSTPMLARAHAQIIVNNVHAKLFDELWSAREIRETRGALGGLPADFSGLTHGPTRPEPPIPRLPRAKMRM